jgi:hypothetical protein
VATFFDRQLKRFGAIDARGNVVIEPQYVKPIVFFNGVATVQQEEDGPALYINKQGQRIEPRRTSEAEAAPMQAADSLHLFQDGDLYGFMDDGGHIVVEPQFTELLRFRYGLATARQGSKFGYIDQNGEFIWSIIR